MDIQTRPRVVQRPLRFPGSATAEAVALARWQGLLDAPSHPDEATTWVLRAAAALGAVGGLSLRPADGSLPIALRALAEAESTLVTRFPDAMEADNIAYTRAWYAAVILRDGALLDRLAAAVPDLLTMRYCPTAAHDERHSAYWAAALTAYRYHPEEVHTLLNQARGRITCALLLPRPRAEYELYAVLLALTADDGPAVERFLVSALRRHRTLWNGNVEQDDKHTRVPAGGGLVALGPLALACLAYDRGIDVRIDSEYLPAGLIDGRLLTSTVG